MAETSRWLRYIVPGSILAFYVSVLALVFPGLVPQPVIRALSKIAGNGFAMSLALVVALLPGLGYILSVAHHLLTWCAGLGSRWYGVDYRRFLCDAQDSGVLRLVVYPGMTEGRYTPTYRGAWRIFTTLWHENRGSGLLRGATPRSETLADLVHGAGTALVGALVACLVLWGALVWSWAKPADEVVTLNALGGWLAIFAVFMLHAPLVAHFIAYRLAKEHFEGFNRATLATFLCKRREELKEPIKCVVMEADLDRCGEEGTFWVIKQAITFLYGLIDALHAVNRRQGRYVYLEGGVFVALEVMARRQKQSVGTFIADWVRGWASGKIGTGLHAVDTLELAGGSPAPGAEELRGSMGDGEHGRKGIGGFKIS